MVQYINWHSIDNKIYLMHKTQSNCTLQLILYVWRKSVEIIDVFVHSFTMAGMSHKLTQESSKCKNYVTESKPLSGFFWWHQLKNSNDVCITFIVGILKYNIFAFLYHETFFVRVCEKKFYGCSLEPKPLLSKSGIQ